MAERKMVMCCKDCRGRSIFLDAYANWDDGQQDWHLHSTYDQAYCDDCEGETTIVRRDLDTGLPVDLDNLFRGEVLTSLGGAG